MWRHRFVGLSPRYRKKEKNVALLSKPAREHAGISFINSGVGHVTCDLLFITPCMWSCKWPCMVACMRPCMGPCMGPCKRPYMGPCKGSCMGPCMGRVRSRAWGRAWGRVWGRAWGHAWGRVWGLVRSHAWGRTWGCARSRFFAVYKRILLGGLCDRLCVIIRLCLNKYATMHKLINYVEFCQEWRLTKQSSKNPGLNYYSVNSKMRNVSTRKMNEFNIFY